MLTPRFAIIIGPSGRPNVQTSTDDVRLVQVFMVPDAAYSEIRSAMLANPGGRLARTDAPKAADAPAEG